MAQEKRDTTESPDPARTYERARPEAESGMGRLDNNRGTPTRRPDKIENPVGNRHENSAQVNAEDVDDERAQRDPNEPDHSMLQEEPLDEGPNDIHSPHAKRHPRKEGKGGLP